MPSTLTQRRSSSNSKSKPSPTKKKKSTSNSAGPIKSSNGNGLPTRPGLSPIDQMTQPNDTGSVIKIFIWGIIILAIGVGLAVVIRNITEQNTEESDNAEIVEQEEPEIIEPVVEETVELENTEEEVELEDTEETTEAEEVPQAEELEETTEPTDATEEYSTFSKLAKTLDEGLEQNTVSINGYSYGTSVEMFTYNIKLANASTYPTTTAVLDEEAKTLTLTIKNIFSDGIVGNGGSGSTELGSTNAQTVEISNSDNTSTFVFSLNTPTEFRLAKSTNDNGVNLLTLEIKNN